MTSPWLALTVAAVLVLVVWVIDRFDRWSD
jgi:hypothetical protein